MVRQGPNANADRPVFIYDTHGEWQATLIGNSLFSVRGEYIGFVEKGDVFKRDGEWIGRLGRDGRILRRRAEIRRDFHPQPPKAPSRPVRLPAHAPLAPLMAELDFSTVDVLCEEPEIFRRISDLRPDLE